MEGLIVLFLFSHAFVFGIYIGAQSLIGFSGYGGTHSVRFVSKGLPFMRALGKPEQLYLGCHRKACCVFMKGGTISGCRSITYGKWEMGQRSGRLNERNLEFVERYLNKIKDISGPPVF